MDRQEAVKKLVEIRHDLRQIKKHFIDNGEDATDHVLGQAVYCINEILKEYGKSLRGRC